MARESLVSAIHIGVALGVLVSVFAVWHVRRVPPVVLHGTDAGPETLIPGE